MLSSEKFLQKVYEIKYNQAPFQIQVICKLVKLYNLEADKEILVDDLFLRNGNLKRSLSHWRSSCPVWKVLKNKDMIKINDKDQTVRLNTELTPAQKVELTNYCKDCLK